jgi:hypothetical protein
VSLISRLAETALQDQELHAARRRQNDLDVRRPALQANTLAPVLEERHQFHPRALRGGNVSHPGGIEAHVCAVVGIKLPELDEDRTAWS